MSPKIHSQDSTSNQKNQDDYDAISDHNQNCLEAYKEAAKSDDLLFGNYDPYEIYKEGN